MVFCLLKEFWKDVSLEQLACFFLQQYKLQTNCTTALFSFHSKMKYATNYNLLVELIDQFANLLNTKNNYNCGTYKKIN